MKKWCFLLIISFCTFAFATPMQDHTIDASALAQLAADLNIPENENLIDATQQRWLRKANQERWEMNELSPDQRVLVLKWATEQGLFSSWKPCCKQYDKALILGATTSRMQMRLDYLKELWEEGIRFKEIVWLTGDRPLDNYADDLTDRCQTESMAAHLLWQETILPNEMRALPVLFIAVPMKIEGRPNTKDTLIAWLQLEPEPCTALFVSDQPFCGYQFAVVKATLPDQILFDLVGPGVDATSHPAAAAITLDSIARWIYQENNF